MPISTHNIRKFLGQNFYRHSANLILLMTFYVFWFQKNVKSHVFWNLKNNEKYVFSNTGPMKFSNIILPTYIFKIICLCVIRKSLRAFIIIDYTISAKWRRIKWKIRPTNFSGSSPARRLLCSKHPRKFVQTSFAQKLQFIGYISVSDS